MDTQPTDQRLRNSKRDHSIFESVLRGPLSNAEVIEKKLLTVSGLAATLTTVSGRMDDRQVIIEFRDIMFNEKVVTLVTGYPTPLPESIRKELEGIYSLFAFDKR